MKNTRLEYEKEKAAAKLVSFYRNMDDLFAVYMEIKMYYKPIAGLIDKEFPFLEQMYLDAEQEFKEKREAKELENKTKNE